MKDFEQLKSEFKSYIRTKANFSDVDFDGSNISILTDYLAYVGQEIALNSHFIANESNIKTAQTRGRVASFANNFGYVGNSMTASKATVKITVKRPNDNTENTLSINESTRLTSNILGDEYSFLVNGIYETVINTNGDFIFPEVNIIQGIRKSVFYKFDERMFRPEFIIPDNDVDIDTIKVIVRPNPSTQEGVQYSRYTTLNGLNNDSTVFFLEENYNGTYQIHFGDNIIGKKPTTDNQIVISYLRTAGKAANGARIFSVSTPIINTTDITVETVSNSFGGNDKESIESIRFSAPLMRATQDRCVVDTDYLINLSKRNSGIETLSVWGGENNEPKLFSKIIISAKPVGRNVFTQQEKNTMWLSIKDMVQPSISPVWLDPEFTYIAVENDIKYVPNSTLLTQSALEQVVKNVILNYSQTELQKFDGVFRLSNLSSRIDNADTGIKSNLTRVYMIKDLPLLASSRNNTTLDYGNPTYITNDTINTLSSEGFYINGVIHYLGDVPSDVSGVRRIYLYKIVEEKRQVVLHDVGKLYSSLGKLELYDIRPTNDVTIKIKVLPESDDLISKRNQLLVIRSEDIITRAYLDTVSMGGSAFGLQDHVTLTKSRL